MLAQGAFSDQAAQEPKRAHLYELTGLGADTDEALFGGQLTYLQLSMRNKPAHRGLVIGGDDALRKLRQIRSVREKIGVTNSRRARGEKYGELWERFVHDDGAQQRPSNWAELEVTRKAYEDLKGRKEWDFSGWFSSICSDKPARIAFVVGAHGADNGEVEVRAVD
jgi:hypothetical protein